MDQRKEQMTALARPLALALALLAAAPAFAQETTPAPAPDTETTAPAPADAAAAAPQAAAPTGNGVGEPYVSETFEAWELRCVRTEDGSDPCQLYQLLKDKETAKRMEGHGADVATSTPAELGALVTSELAKWKQVVQRAKLTAD